MSTEEVSKSTLLGGSWVDTKEEATLPVNSENTPSGDSWVDTKEEATLPVNSESTPLGGSWVDAKKEVTLSVNLESTPLGGSWVDAKKEATSSVNSESTPLGSSWVDAKKEATLSVNLESTSDENSSVKVKGGYPVLLPEERLNSSHMRTFISQLGFRESEGTFPVGTSKKCKFFYKKGDSSQGKVYIALAHNKEKGHAEAQTSGENSLSTVLEKIKKDIEKNLITNETDNSKAPIKLLIPLQQISKKHWVLLELEVDISSLTAGKATVKHYDPKGKFSVSCAKDYWTSEARKRIKKWVQATFKDTREEDFKIPEYTRKQGASDSINCGRYVLKKLFELLKQENHVMSIKDVNSIKDVDAIINGEMKIPKESLKPPVNKRITSNQQLKSSKNFSTSREVEFIQDGVHFKPR